MIIFIGLAVAIFVPLIYSICLARQDVRRWDEHHDLRKKYQLLMNQAETTDASNRLWDEFNRECDKREKS